MNYDEFVSVKLTGITMPRLEGVQTPSQLLAHHARVSNTANQFNHLTGPKLLRSLIKRREWSPFEMVAMSMEFKTTRDITHQVLRHGKAFGFQEFSQRYARVNGPVVLKEARYAHPTDRQKTLEVVSEEDALWWEFAQIDLNGDARSVYEEALRRGFGKEVARSVLPEGNTPSTIYVAGWLRSWIHYVGLRGKESTQKEHRMLADPAHEIMTAEFPDLAEVLAEYYLWEDVHREEANKNAGV